MANGPLFIVSISLTLPLDYKYLHKYGTFLNQFYKCWLALNRALRTPLKLLQMTILFTLYPEHKNILQIQFHRHRKLSDNTYILIINLFHVTRNIKKKKKKTKNNCLSFD
jgi:hypothetical protein